MTQVDLSSYKILFVKTANEYIGKLNSDLQTAINEPGNSEAINNIYISFHSLGSQNLTMTYTSTGNLCRLFENFFHKVKNGESTADSEKLRFVLDTVTRIKESINNVETNNAELNLEAEQKTVKERLGLA